MYNLSWNRFYIEDFYNVAMVRPFVTLSDAFWRVVDDTFVDGAVNGVARLIRSVGGELRRVQTGYIRNYALSFLLGVVVVVVWFVLR